MLPPQGEPRKRSVGRRFSSFVTLFRRVSAAGAALQRRLRPALPAFGGTSRAWLHCLLPSVCPASTQAMTVQPAPCRIHPLPRPQLREELGPAAMRGLDPPPRRSLQGVNRKCAGWASQACRVQLSRAELPVLCAASRGIHSCWACACLAWHPLCRAAPPTAQHARFSPSLPGLSWWSSGALSWSSGCGG